MISKAQVKTWNGNGNGISWSDANNWSPVGVPQSSDIAVIQDDSVWATGGVEVRGLILNNYGILNYDTTPIYEFEINNSPTDGLVMQNDAKFYINSKVKISNSFYTGLKMEGNNQLIIGNDGILEIGQVGENGIESSVNASLENHGEINIGTYDDDGLIAFSVNNFGTINIGGGGLRAAQIGGVGSKNKGEMNFEGSVVMFPSSTFTNEVNASFTSTGLLVVLGTFNNKGMLHSNSLSYGSLSVGGNGNFNNFGQFLFKYSNTHNIVIGNQAELVNKENGVIENLDSTASPLQDVYAISMSGATSGLSNEGTINLNLNGIREGIKLSGGSKLSNTGILNIKGYYKYGLLTEALSTTDLIVENSKSAELIIGAGATSTSTALVINDKNNLQNDECSSVIIEDSTSMQGGSSTNIVNLGYMEMKAFNKANSPEFYNAGAIFFTLPQDLSSAFLNQFDNEGLIYSKNPVQLESGVQVFPLFAGFHPDAAPYLSNALVKENGVFVSPGDYTPEDNVLKTNASAFRKDTVYITYTFGECASRILKLPFYKNPVWDCSSAPAETVTFMGHVNESWHNPDNWSNNEIPRNCDKVIIPNGQRCEIDPASTVQAKSILVESGAYFLAPTGVVATFEPN
ncbi:hypothetical protein DJ013_20655 [Arcticibacterium luteifluviistationis]|uniref:G8 domain-containing protein n=2 Tax=Arcticibacterium luteifluviistationis TaxID=1784714 RepID=A0A2Z4GHE6_9BACT|nr:hypothetical protein DJ013_20655 [Arcticibacterium luteifluviistationis]